MNLFDILVEGVYDPGIMKAVFLAGGPGSGKSRVTSQIFGIPKEIQFSHSGLKLVNSDPAFEHFLKKAGYGTKLNKLSKDDIDFVTGATGDENSPRLKAKKILQKKFDLYTENRLGLIIDGTGRDEDKIREQNSELKELGYDTAMIFVDTSLETALERNNARERTLPKNIVVRAWKNVQKNKSDFNRLFGKNFFVVKNENNLNSDGTIDIPRDVQKIINKFVRQPIQNPKGKQWIKTALELKKNK